MDVEAALKLSTQVALGRQIDAAHASDAVLALADAVQDLRLANARLTKRLNCCPHCGQARIDGICSRCNG